MDRYGSENWGLAQDASWLLNTYFNLMSSHQHRLTGCSRQGERQIMGYQHFQKLNGEMHVLSTGTLEKGYGCSYLDPVCWFSIVWTVWCGESRAAAQRRSQPHSSKIVLAVETRIPSWIGWERGVEFGISSMARLPQENSELPCIDNNT